MSFHLPSRKTVAFAFLGVFVGGVDPGDLGAERERANVRRQIH